MKKNLKPLNPKAILREAAPKDKPGRPNRAIFEKGAQIED